MESDDMITLDPTGHYRCPWYSQQLMLLIPTTWMYLILHCKSSHWGICCPGSTDCLRPMSVAWFDMIWLVYPMWCLFIHLQPVALPNFSWLCEVSFHNFHVKCVRHGALEAHRVYKAGSYWIWGYFERHGEPLFSSHMLDLSEEPLVGTRRAHKHGEVLEGWQHIPLALLLDHAD